MKKYLYATLAAIVVLLPTQGYAAPSAATAIAANPSAAGINWQKHPLSWWDIIILVNGGMVTKNTPAPSADFWQVHTSYVLVSQTAEQCSAIWWDLPTAADLPGVFEIELLPGFQLKKPPVQADVTPMVFGEPGSPYVTEYGFDKNSETGKVYGFNWKSLPGEIPFPGLIDYQDGEKIFAKTPDGYTVMVTVQRIKPNAAIKNNPLMEAMAFTAFDDATWEYVDRFEEGPLATQAQISTLKTALAWAKAH